MDKTFLKKTARSLGVDFFGVADLEPFRAEKTLPGHLLDSYSRAVSLGVRLSPGVFELLDDGPIPLYAHHYVVANNLLDQAALRLANTILNDGHRALPVPASRVEDRENHLGAISHKAVARMSGLGWQGKSLLLINPRVGPRLRLTTILTDLELPADQPLPNRCGQCRECVKACPAGAIKGTPFGDGYKNREEAWDLSACTRKLAEDFSQRPGINSMICGLCIKACPFGRLVKKAKNKDESFGDH